MSETTNTGTGGRTMRTVNGKVGNADVSQGELKFVRPSKLTEADVNTTVAAGIFEGTVPNKFDDQKLDYKVRASNGDLTILNSAGSLASQMNKIEIGSYIEILYKGKSIMKSGKGAGKEAHGFVVLVEATEDEQSA